MAQKRVATHDELIRLVRRAHSRDFHAKVDEEMLRKGLDPEGLSLLVLYIYDHRRDVEGERKYPMHHRVEVFFDLLAHGGLEPQNTAPWRRRRTLLR